MNRNPIPDQIYTRQEVIRASTKLQEFSVEPGVEYIAPEGKTVTMTVDGVETDWVPGTYTGDVRLCVRDAIPAPFQAGFFSKGPVSLRSGLYVTEQGVSYDQSVDEVIQGAEVTEDGISGGKLISRGKHFCGVVVKDRKYHISGMTMDLSGRGGDDFIGVGAGILVGGTAEVLVEDCSITTNGCIRPALVAGGNATVLMRNCEVTSNGGTAMEERKTPGMNNVPWTLGLSGNCRGTNVVKGAKVHYENCKMRSYGWGVLSTDDPDNLELYAKDCLIEITGPSGYGSYAVGNGRNTFDHCVFRVPDYALIVAEAPAGGVFKNGTEIHSGRNGIMWHSNRGGETRIEAGCRIYTQEAAFVVKSCYPKLDVRDSVIEPKNGVILQMMDSDDAGLFASEFVVPEGSSMRQTDFDTNAIHDTDMQATFHDMTLTGDFYNGTTGAYVKNRDGSVSSTAANLVLTLDNTVLTGCVSASETHYLNMKPGEKITPENNRELGRVSNTAKPAVNNGVLLQMIGSTWRVTNTCYLTGLTLDENSAIQGTITVDGRLVTPVSGISYKGEIVVLPA